MFERAVKFATKAHRGQVRKYTDEPYIMHPLAVAEIVRTVSGHTEEMLVAAVLHDVVEDTDVDINDICEEFGTVVGMYVSYLTDVSVPEDGTRARRKEKDAHHVAAGPAEVHTIKVADLMHNTADIYEHDPRFWEVYKHEKWFLLNLLTEADSQLWLKAKSQLKEMW